MENENVNQITTEELSQAYQQLLQQAQELERRYQALLQDRTLEKIKVISGIVQNKADFSEEIVELANWHLVQMLAKPKA